MTQDDEEFKGEKLLRIPAGLAKLYHEYVKNFEPLGLTAWTKYMRFVLMREGDKMRDELEKLKAQEKD